MAKAKEPEKLEPNYFGELILFAIRELISSAFREVREVVPFALREFLISIFSPIIN